MVLKVKCVRSLGYFIWFIMNNQLKLPLQNFKDLFKSVENNWPADSSLLICTKNKYLKLIQFIYLFSETRWLWIWWVSRLWWTRREWSCIGSTRRFELNSGEHRSSSSHVFTIPEFTNLRIFSRFCFFYKFRSFLLRSKMPI